MARKKKQPEEPEDDDMPWNEEKWEAFMKESDVRSAKFGELLETLHDDPDHERKIAQEMGWDHIVEALDEQEAGLLNDEDDEDDPDADFDPEKYIQAGIEEYEKEKAEDAALSPEEFEARMQREWDEDPAHQIPAFQVCEKAGELVQVALDPYMQGESTNDDFSELLGEAFIGIHIACAKIVGGDGMGYDDDVLCGNIVCNKRGLEGAQQSLRALLELRERKMLDPAIVDPLIPPVQEGIKALEVRIAELRSRVWWK